MHTRRLSVACLAACVLSSLACVQSEQGNLPATGAAGTSGAAGMGAAGSTTGAAGSTTGAAGSTTGAAGSTTGAAGNNTTGAAGSTTGAAGNTTGAAGNTTGAAGSTTGAAGNGGAAGAKDGGAAGTGAADAGVSNDAGSDAPPTFTMLYNQILGPTPRVAASSCAGAQCHHSPGGGKGLEHIDMNTKAAAYVGVKKFVVAGNVNGSKLYTEVNTGAMPEGKPKLPADLIKMVADWIRAGALDN